MSSGAVYSRAAGDCMQGGLGGARRPSGSARLRFSGRGKLRRAGAARRSYARNHESSAKRNYLPRRGAETLARQIENYWRSLGFNIRTWLVPVKGCDDDSEVGAVTTRHRRSNLWCVRSSLANGLPPGRANPFHGGDSHARARFHRPSVNISTQHLLAKHRRSIGRVTSQRFPKLAHFPINFLHPPA